MAPEPQAIRQLDDVTASRIAAGEVVERPASVVKELVENALDAGATSVRVEIQQGGRRLIRVTDDGSGIPADQVELALARHATSKIRTAADLDNVTTLGFRGEALAAIASVSHLTIRTRTAGADAAVELVVDNGHEVRRGLVPAAVGTQVTVENLFHAHPARLKFLRTDKTEASHVVQLVTRHALARPTCRFELLSDGRRLLMSPGTGDDADALVAAFGLGVARELIPLPRGQAAVVIDEESGGFGAVSVSGYVAPPRANRATRRDISLFVNGRPIQNASLSFAVVKAYRGLLPTGRFPIALVIMSLPPGRVEVNVHPAKAEVRFRDEGLVFAAVERAVRQAVAGGAAVPLVREDAGWRPADAAPVPNAATGAPFGQGSAWPLAADAPWPDDSRAAPAAAGPAAARDAVPAPAHRHQPGLPPLRVLGQLDRTFIVAEGPEGLYLIDQHAAHERVVYEDLQSRPGTVASQRLLVPQPVTLPAHVLARGPELLRALADVGFDVELFGNDAFLVRAVPQVLAHLDPPACLADVLALADVGRSQVAEALSARLVRAVCKQATVKGGQTMTLEEMRVLVRRLEATESPRTCPHGRPTVVLLTTDRIAREFHRT